VQPLSGQNTSFDAKTYKTVEQAILDYLHEKRGTLDSKKESSKHTMRKVACILEPLTLFLKKRGIVYLKDVKTEDLSAFQETWLGRPQKDPVTGQIVFQPKSLIGKQKNQEFLKMFFKRARLLRWITENPAELLLAIKPGRSEVKKL